MTFGIASVIAGKIMFPVLCRQGFFPNNHSHNIQNLINVFAPPFHEVEVFCKFVSKYRGKHGTTLEGCFQGGFKFFAGLALPGVYEYGAGNFPPQHGLALLESGDSFGIGGMLHFPAMGANIPGVSPGLDLFGLFYGVHRALLCLEYTLSGRIMQLFAFRGLPGAAAFGHLPNSLKSGEWVDDLPCKGFYTQYTEPLVDRPFRYAELFSQFLYGKTFHTFIFVEKTKKVKIFLSKVFTNIR
jgi:hypothetical protein